MINSMDHIIAEGHPTYGHQCYSKALCRRRRLSGRRRAPAADHLHGARRGGQGQRDEADRHHERARRADDEPRGEGGVTVSKSNGGHPSGPAEPLLFHALHRPRRDVPQPDRRLADVPVPRPSTAVRPGGTWRITGASRWAASAAAFVEATGVSPEGRITPGCTGLWNEAQRDLFCRHHRALPLAGRSGAASSWRMPGARRARRGRGTGRRRWRPPIRKRGRRWRRARFRSPRAGRRRAR